MSDSSVASSTLVSPASVLGIGSAAAPLYILSYDKLGNCTSPRTLETILEKARNGSYHHLHVYSHGWNNVFSVAEKLFTNFFLAYLSNRQRPGVRGTPLDRTAFVGIVWPSTALVAPWEATPKIAAVGVDSIENEQYTNDVEALIDELTPAEQRQFLDLVNQRQPHPRAAEEVARLLLPIFERANDESGAVRVGVDVADIIRVAGAASAKPAPKEKAATTDAPGFASDVDDFADSAAGERFVQHPVAAGGISYLDPRWVVRIASVLLMKDRAGTVGAGVGRSLIEPILATTQSHVHSVGHSFGTKVVLSSICAVPLTRPVDSLLLLEPAISKLCFASNVDAQHHAGGYRPALDRVISPIFSTWSSQDTELRHFYALAVRRAADVGEQKIAGLLDRNEALGGYGPAGMQPGEYRAIELAEPGVPYPRDPTARVYGLDGSNGRIRSHGNVTTDYTAWAHVALVDGAWTA